MPPRGDRGRNRPRRNAAPSSPVPKHAGAPPTHIDLTDPTLFGSEIAEDERDDIFYSYALERRELDAFADKRQALCIARAYKGEGKSALLRLTGRRVRQEVSDALVMHVNAPAIAPEVSRDDYAAWVRGWKAALVSLIAREIGATIEMAWDDDAMTLVEEAEKSGRKKRSILSAILERLVAPSVKAPGVEIALPVQKATPTVSPEGATQRWLSKRRILWLIIDDVDRNFEPTRTNKMQTAAFFEACRELTNNMPEIRIRTAVRPNIYTILRLEFESLSHIQQYVTDLSWSEADIRAMLATRIAGYLRRRGRGKEVEALTRGDDQERETSLIGLVFEENMKWGKGTRPPHVILYTLSKHRPRWVIELAKVAAARAARLNRSKISLDDIVDDFATFGNNRLQDTAAEFRPRCAEVEELLSAFNREREQLTTAELLDVIDTKILSHLDVRIAGVSTRPSNVQVAALLFEIGLFYARRDYPDGSYEHLTFSDRPTLLRSRASLDDGLAWEIHPVFRQALEMRDSAGQTIRYGKPRPVR
jgi:hypothetical protein